MLLGLNNSPNLTLLDDKLHYFKDTPLKTILLLTVLKYQFL